MKHAAEQVWDTCGYVRLSREDGGKPGADTIGSQRELVLNYISQQTDMELYDLYCDNGQTGTNFERPGFERLMDDVRSGKVNCVVVKDDCVIIELNAESPIKCGFCAVSSIF